MKWSDIEIIDDKGTLHKGEAAAAFVRKHCPEVPIGPIPKLPTSICLNPGKPNQSVALKDIRKALFYGLLYKAKSLKITKGPKDERKAVPLARAVNNVVDAEPPAPVIEVAAPGILIVPQSYHGKPRPGVRPHRIPVRLSASPKCDGTGLFTYPDYLKAFDARHAADPLPSPLPLTNGDLAGRTIYLEASEPSPANLGTALKMELVGCSVAPRPPAIQNITCVRLTIDVFEDPKASPAEPQRAPLKMPGNEPKAKDKPLSAEAKIFPGRAVEVAGSRAKMAVSRALPADFPGKILLRPLGSNLDVHEAEAVGAEPPLAEDKLGFENSSLAEPKTLWTGARRVSDAVADTGWFLAVEGVKEDDKLVEGDRVDLTAVTLTLEMFTGPIAAGTPITIAPFYPIDEAALLDAVLPDAEHNQPAAGLPAQHKAAFEAPKKDFFDDHAAANDDAKVFRFRVKVVPSVEAIAAETLQLKVNVLSKDGAAPTVTTSVAYKSPAGIASHEAGIVFALQKKPAENLFLSPYLRVLTIAHKTRSWVDDYAIIHSLPPVGSDNVELGCQFGRQLKVSADPLYSLKGDFRLGGVPYARIPVQFFYVNTAPPEPRSVPVVNAKIHQLNQYWAASGLEFYFADPAARLIYKTPPDTSLVTVGEDTGCAIVSAVPFDLTVELKIANGPDSGSVLLDVSLPANSSSLDAANALRARIRELEFPAGWLRGLKLDAEIFDLVNPRSELSFDLGICRDDAGTGYDMTALPNRVPLPPLGTNGPVDINFRAASTSPVALTSISVVKIEAFDSSSGVPLKSDLKAPSMIKPDHGVARNPPDVVTRHWLRQFAPKGPRYVSVVFEGSGCYPDDTGSRTLINPGIWNEPDARLICYMKDTCLAVGPDDVQHEMAHVLGRRLNHTLFHPKWFYSGELLHNGSGQPSNKTTRMTSRKIFVDGLEFYNGQWHAAYIALPNGYGGACRDGVANINPAWLAVPAQGQLPW